MPQHPTTTKQVRFNLSGTDTYYVSHLKDLSDRQKRRIWYSSEEYDSIKFEIDETLKLLSNGLSDPERAGYCFRGLENKVQSVIDRSVRSVLGVQRLSKGSVATSEDETLMSRQYHSCAKHAVISARKAAWDDARCVVVINNVDWPPKPPRRKKQTIARAGWCRLWWFFIIHWSSKTERLRNDSMPASAKRDVSNKCCFGSKQKRFAFQKKHNA